MAKKSKFSAVKYLVAAALTCLIATGCSDDSNDNKLPAPDYPVLANDNQPAIDVSRGNYICFDMVTSMGTIALALDSHYAANTTENFRQYAAVGFYDNTIFHRVIDSFMIQGGGFTPGLERKETMAPIDLESRNGLRNYKGRIAMARTANPRSTTSQFFINTVNNHFLDQPNAGDGYGYTVFGGVIAGMDVVEAIEQVETGSVGGMRDVPIEHVVIESVRETDCPAD